MVSEDQESRSSETIFLLRVSHNISVKLLIKTMVSEDLIKIEVLLSKSCNS